MIRDVLAQAVDDLDHYLDDPFWDHIYRADLRERVIRLRGEAKYVQILLDKPRASYESGLRQTGVRPVSILKTEAAVVNDRQCV